MWLPLGLDRHNHVCASLTCRYADSAKQIVCKAVVNEDPNAKVQIFTDTVIDRQTDTT